MQKVLVIVPFPMNEENRRQRMAQLQAVKLAPDIEFDFRPVRAAPANYTSEHDSVLADISIVDAGRNAEAEGYAAVCIDTMSDSGVNALRSMLSTRTRSRWFVRFMEVGKTKSSSSRISMVLIRAL